ncbi:MAG: HPr(Ser) kinase/phosphatase [Verrucomicrobiota bacterium]
MAISVQAFFETCSGPLKLRLLAGGRGTGREIAAARAQEAGLAVTGEVVAPAAGRVQILGDLEIAYFARQEPGRQAELADRFFAGPIPCAVIGGDGAVAGCFAEAAERGGVPLFVSGLASAELLEETDKQLDRLFKESTTLHGVMLDVLGVGVLLTGPSGVGKSECALDLVLRGSRFVADDVVLVEKAGPSTLVGGGNDLTQHHMEIRGLGILNIRDLFGLTATTRAKKLELVIQLEGWEPRKEYDRLGVEEETVEILGVPLPCLLVPVSPGRNLATIVEVAVRNHLLKLRGVRSAWELVERQGRKARGKRTP